MENFQIHRTIGVTLELQTSEWAQHYRLPPAAPPESFVPLHNEKTPGWRWTGHEAAWEAAKAQDVQQRYLTWSRRWAQLLAARAEAKGTPVAPAFHRKGQMLTPQWQRVQVPTQSADTACVALRRVARYRGQLLSLQTKLAKHYLIEEMFHRAMTAQRAKAYPIAQAPCMSTRRSQHALH